MPLSDFVPTFGEGNISTYYRNVLGVPVRKRVIISVLTVFLLFLIFVCAFALSRNAKSNGKRRILNAPYVTIPSAINYSVDPCVDFYEFSCGLWSQSDIVSSKISPRITTFSILQDFVEMTENSIFKTATENNNLPRVVNDAIRFYKLCQDEDNYGVYSVNYLLDYFNKALGGWPVLNPTKWKAHDFDWIMSSAYLMKTLHVSTVVDIYSILDDEDSSRRLVYLRPPAVKNEHTLNEDITHQVLYFVLTSLNNSEVNVGKVSEDIDAIHKSVIKWNNLFSQPLSKPQRVKMSFKQLKERIPSFDMLQYVQLVMNDTLKELHREITEDDDVVVDDYKYLEKSMYRLKNSSFSQRDYANLFGWFAVKEIWFLMPGMLAAHAKVFGYTAEEVKEVKNQKCLKALFDMYECSVDYLYVEYASLTGISDGKKLVQYIKNALHDLLSHSNWLDPATKTSAILKLNLMQSVIGFPDYLHNKTEFDKLYQDFPHLSNSILQTYFQIKAYFSSLQVADIKSDNPISQVVSPRSITDVSAYYDLQRNMFTLPISMYNPPFYYLGGPWYLNFGAVGSIIGHEIMHGFDSTGYQRGKTGSLKKWWTNASISTYKNRTDCFKDMYAPLTDKNNATSNDSSTLDEDVADNEGLRMAYLAYKHFETDHGQEASNLSPYTSEQMFFISFASVWCSKIDPDVDLHQIDVRHSAPRLRVNGAVSNSEYFSHVFNCPVGFPMNPEQKCLMW